MTVQTPTHFENTLGHSGAVEEYYGNFTYSNGLLTGGTVSSVVEIYHGQTIFTVTDLNVPALVLNNALLADDDGQSFADLVFGGADSIQGSPGGDILEGYTGADTIIALDGDDSVDGGAGNDDVNGNVGNDIVLGGDGNDWVRGGKGNDTVFGGAGDDPHVNGNLGDDLVSGGTGNDTVYGGQGADTLSGDDGNDLLSGDLGADILTGGAGADRFAFARGGGVDWVSDFHATEGDRVQLAAGTAYTVVKVTGQVVIDIGGGDQIGLAGVPFETFSASWILFA